MPTPALPFAVFLLTTAPTESVTLRSDSDCPRDTEVRARLYAMIPRGRSGTATIDISSREPQQLTLRLEADGADASAVRVVTVSEDCAERAGAAAVVVAAWLAEVPVSPLPPPDVPVVVTRPPPAITHPPTLRSRPLIFEIGAGIVGAPVDWAPGGRVELSVGRLGHPLAFWLDATATRGRDKQLAGHTVRWSRPSTSAGLRLHSSLLGPVLSIDAGATGSAVVAEGQGFDIDSNDLGFALGAVAGIRVAWPLGRASVWLDGRGLWWPGSQRLRVAVPAGGSATRLLPATEAHLAAGIGVRAF